MSDKLYQVIDNVHGAIYYSEFEKDIMNTPYFNRLHDVNQSSTVYFIFPPNRTKRYEHSLGTMQITSDLFYNAVINARGNEAFQILFQKTEDNFAEIVKFYKNMSNYPFYFDKKIMNGFHIVTHKKIEDIKEIISKNFVSCFSNHYLIQSVPKFLNNDLEAFLFLCLFQALRIIGLLHDCGHPPQSHIIETVLDEIYDELNDSKSAKTPRTKTFLKILDTYRDEKDDRIINIDNKMAIKTEKGKREHLHEMVGLQVIFNIFNTVLPEYLEKDLEQKDDNSKLVLFLYHLTVMEFSFAIVRNKSDFWKSLHEIIDGVIDSDRLDFVARDSKNSGMEWGNVPYKRIVNYAKLETVEPLTHMKHDIRVCFTEKCMDSLDELLRDRYKIFAYINYHHRSTRISTLYQLAVKSMSMEYLSQADEDDDLPADAAYDDISGLWRAIQMVYSPQQQMLNFIQWNDSWLNGLLCKELVRLSTTTVMSFDCPSNCQLYLEEIFLNEKKYWSLVKRNTEQREINNTILNTLEGLIATLKNEQISLSDKIANAIKEKKTDKIMDYKNLYELMDFAVTSIQACNWGDLEKQLGAFYLAAIETVLKKYCLAADDYILKRVSFSLGLTDNAFVYDYKDHVRMFVKCSTIKAELMNAHRNFPFYYVYIRTDKELTKSLDFEQIRNDIGQEIGRIIKERCEIHYLEIS